jgi:hypothetical protein
MLKIIQINYFKLYYYVSVINRPNQDNFNVVQKFSDIALNRGRLCLSGSKLLRSFDVSLITLLNLS